MENTVLEHICWAPWVQLKRYQSKLRFCKSHFGNWAMVIVEKLVYMLKMFYWFFAGNTEMVVNRKQLVYSTLLFIGGSKWKLHENDSKHAVEVKYPSLVVIISVHVAQWYVRASNYSLKGYSLYMHNVSSTNYFSPCPKVIDWTNRCNLHLSSI